MEKSGNEDRVTGYKNEKGLTKSVNLMDRNLEILKFLSQYLTITQIAQLRKTSRNAVYNVLKRLLQNGLVRKIGMGYELTERGLHLLNGSRPNSIRLHNLIFKVTILGSKNNYELKRNKIVQMRILSHPVNLQNTSYEIHSFSNVKIKTTPKSIIAYMPTFYGKSTDECFSQALYSFFNLLPKIESLFGIILVKDKKFNIEIISQHYSKLQDSLARIYHTEGNKLYVKDEEGNVWLIADYSFRVDELETIYNKTAKEDMDMMQGFLNDLRKNPVKMSEVVGALNMMTQNMLMFDKNMLSHIQAVKELGSGVRKLTKTIGGIIRENQKLKMRGQKTLGDYD